MSVQTTRKRYSVRTQHPTGYKDGWHEVTVTVPSWGQPYGSRYVDGAEVGCSRDYNTDSDRVAIQCLLRDLAMTLVDLKPLD